MNPTQILIADDHELFRRSLRSLLESRPDWRVCGEATDGKEAVEKAKALKPDVILLDVSMPEMNGLDAARFILREAPESKILIVSQNDAGLMRKAAEEAGAKGFIEKSKLSQNLVSAIESLATNGSNRNFAGESPARTQTVHNDPRARWFQGGGEMGEVMRSTDWSKTPLGPAESWSPALRMMVSFLLANRFPQLLWWGPEFCSLYNDAYIPVLGDKHPWAIGRPVSEVWHEIWDVLKPLIETPFHGGPPTWMEDIELFLNRRGFLEETHFTVAYSPVPDETTSSGIGGVLATVHEITEKVIGERRIVVLRELGAQSAEAKSAEEACANAASVLSRHKKDVPFVLLYLFDSNGQSAHLAASSGVDEADEQLLKVFDPQANSHIWPAAKMMEEQSICLFETPLDKFKTPPKSAWSDGVTTAAVVPVHSNLLHQLAGFFVVGISPRLQFDQSHRNFLELMSTQIATSIANARAYEEERKRAEALAEIDRAKTLFFSNVSHEFRTPLTLMMGPLEDALNQADGLSDPNRERLDVAHRNSLRLLKLVNTLLDFSRIEAGRIQASYEPTDLAVVTAELAGVFRSTIERAGMRLVVDCPELPEEVYVDREMWEKIVLNLLSNAFKFTFDGEIAVSLRPVGTGVELTVRDTGTGIPAEEIPRLFERFHRVKNARGRSYEGSGIGLALVQELVKLHGGSVRIESELDRGSAFVVNVPFGKDHLPAERVHGERTMVSTGLRGEAFVEEAMRWLPNSATITREMIAAPLSAGESRQTKRSSSRILLADDNADMREYVRKLLSKEYEVVAVADGESALNSARAQRPDLVLSDIMMPRLDGFGLLREIRADENLKNVPVILLSARVEEESRLEGLSAGADDYLAKPFSARELLARVGSHLAMSRMRQQAAETERNLRRDAELLSAIVASSDDAIISKNLDGIITSWNKGAERIFGYSAEEAVGKSITLIIPPDRLDEEAHILSRLRRGQRIDHFETVRMRKDGSMLDISVTISPMKDSSGRVLGASKVARDISALKQAERSLREVTETLEVEVHARTAELEQRNTDVLRQSELLRDLSRRLLQAQDEERRRIARELHDSAGQTLTVLGMTLAIVARQSERQKISEVSQNVRDAEQLVRQLHQEIRTMSYLLHPPLLDEAGLSAALTWYIEGLTARSGLKLSLAISDGFERLPRDMELVVFRLVQECLTNIHRHSGSKTAEIRILREPGQITVEVRDEGKGISPERLAELQAGASGVGIRGMRERVRPFNGDIQIESNGSGTRVLVTMPLPKASVQELQKPAEPLPAAV